MEEKATVELRGIVEGVTFRREDTGFTVIEVDTGEELVNAVGVMPKVNVGEQLHLIGVWDVHPSFGHQFRVSACQQCLPASASAILRYLSSGAIKGVRESTALKIVEAFGTETFEVIEHEPERLAQIHGISRQKALAIQEEFEKQFLVREMMVALADLGLTTTESMKAYKALGPTAAEKLRENPYALCNLGIGVSFVRADELAAALPKRPPDGCRAKAGVLFVLRHNLGNGHTCVPRRKLIPPVMSLLECEEEPAQLAVDELLEKRLMVEESIDGEAFLFLPYIYEAEAGIAARIKIMTQFPPAHSAACDGEIAAMEEKWGISFEEGQRRAIKIAMEKGLLILTGGPGTGKTTTLRGILGLLQSHEFHVALTAPTGRAAKRMSELAGQEAKTIHRLLEVEWRDSAGVSFVHNEEDPLDVDAVIVDEVSMVDITLFESLLEALPMGCRLIMVGDVDQLPPVGAGNVLQDLIASGRIPVVELNRVFRQAMESLIISNAHAIVGGQMPELSKKDKDFFFLRDQNPFHAGKTVVDLLSTRLPKSYGYSPMTDIQILCPSRKGELGTVTINKLAQSVLNPKEKGKHEAAYNGYILREGDKVMQVKNNYDVAWSRPDETGTGVFNGDVGTLMKVDPASGMLTVLFDDKLAVYSAEAAGELELAYAVTVHKSQGSEFEAVIMPLLGVPPMLSYRNLLYTGVTRAKKLLILVGSEAVVERMVENDRKTKRYSALHYFLRQDHEE